MNDLHTDKSKHFVRIECNTRPFLVQLAMERGHVVVHGFERSNDGKRGHLGAIERSGLVQIGDVLVVVGEEMQKFRSLEKAQQALTTAQLPAVLTFRRVVTVKETLGEYTEQEIARYLVLQDNLLASGRGVEEAALLVQACIEVFGESQSTMLLQDYIMHLEQVMLPSLGILRDDTQIDKKQQFEQIKQVMEKLHQRVDARKKEEVKELDVKLMSFVYYERQANSTKRGKDHDTIMKMFINRMLPSVVILSGEMKITGRKLSVYDAALNNSKLYAKRGDDDTKEEEFSEAAREIMAISDDEADVLGPASSPFASIISTIEQIKEYPVDVSISLVDVNFRLNLCEGAATYYMALQRIIRRTMDTSSVGLANLAELRDGTYLENKLTRLDARPTEPPKLKVETGDFGKCQYTAERVTLSGTVWQYVTRTQESTDRMAHSQNAAAPEEMKTAASSRSDTPNDSIWDEYLESPFFSLRFHFFLSCQVTRDHIFLSIGSASLTEPKVAQLKHRVCLGQLLQDLDMINVVDSKVSRRKAGARFEHALHQRAAGAHGRGPSSTSNYSRKQTLFSQTSVVDSDGSDRASFFETDSVFGQTDRDSDMHTSSQAEVASEASLHDRSGPHEMPPPLQVAVAGDTSGRHERSGLFF
ncbi:hypothetical protein BBO99_00007479 [Phytophthora kernoviae]|uniref:VWFA domain-containing protein n=2 Tax=Phytophthora kernoviae TaxID=325452 RepID=A0A3R7FYF3_9STRA|nr:hypothetical protein G195_008633 [Phytophthora kernoviae 00238/432]KAG2520768.1 hypothetical protein JM18_006955 [Phytophthora kernoviae]RLN05876.1 hypothetical protein BBI17_007456 [Phytophthora kernoviae]RLN76534.1 hypothetical protein BBO99_00007479 [Phytophthora kernoviae]